MAWTGLSCIRASPTEVSAPAPVAAGALRAAAARCLRRPRRDRRLLGGDRPRFSIDEGLGNARREALWALARAKDAAERLARFPEDGDDPTWLPADAASLDALVRRTLGPVIEADRRRRGEPRALAARVARARPSHGAAATRLMIHKHTLAYRLKRVEQLTGRSLATTGDLAELWLALRALDVVGTLDYTEEGSIPETVEGLRVALPLLHHLDPQVEEDPLPSNGWICSRAAEPISSSASARPCRSGCPSGSRARRRSMRGCARARRPVRSRRRSRRPNAAPPRG